MIKNRIFWEKWADPFVNDNDDEPKNLGPVLVGPMGVIPLTENATPSKVYNFWLGHTNFNITSSIENVIENTPGVETLDVFTRYRFRIAIGKAFCDEKFGDVGHSVMQAIEHQLCTVTKVIVSKQEGNLDVVEMLKKELIGKRPHWVIFALPDGSLLPKWADTKEEMLAITATEDKKVVASSD